MLLGAFTLRRFDMWPAAICVGVLLLLADDRPLAALVLLAVGTLIKWYPVILLPIALLSQRRFQRQIDKGRARRYAQSLAAFLQTSANKR